MATRPPLHCLVYAPAGGYKSTFAATFPKPMLVLGFDPAAKLYPYYHRGIALPEEKGNAGQGVIQVYDKTKPDALVIQVEVFADDEIAPDGTLRPTAYQRFIARQPSMYEEIREGTWKTVVLDTVTAMSLASSNNHEFSLNTHFAKDLRKLGGAAKRDLQQAICTRLVNVLRGVNFVVLTHEAQVREEETVGQEKVTKLRPSGQAAAPGSLASEDGLPSKFPEMYYIKATQVVGESEITRSIQTQRDRFHNAMSGINAPNGCLPHYNALWKNWDEESKNETA